MEKYKLFSGVLKELRLSQGLTQEQLAERASINEKYYSRVERGESFPTLKIIFKLCDALEIKVSQVMVIIEKN